MLWVTEHTFSKEAPGLQISGCCSLKVEFQAALMGPVQAEPEQVPCDGATEYLQREMLETWGAKGIHITGGEGLSLVSLFLLLSVCTQLFAECSYTMLTRRGQVCKRKLL